MMKSVIPSEPSDYCRYMEDWLLSVQEQTTLQIANLLNLIGSLQTLHLLKDTVPVSSILCIISKFLEFPILMITKNNDVGFYQINFSLSLKTGLRL